MVLNIEGTLQKALSASLGVPVHDSVPENPPDAFVTIERTGGGDEATKISDNPTVVFDCYGATRDEAFNLANKLDAFIKSAPGAVDGIANATPNSVIVHYPDTVLRRERYESTYNFVTYRYK